MKYILIIITYFCVFLQKNSAQVTDLTRVEYTYFPQRGSDNSFRRFRTFVNIPLKLNDKGAFLVPKLEYRNVNFDYKDPTTFSTDRLDKFQHFEVGLGYTFKMSKDWRFAVQGGVIAASNFQNDKLIGDDLITTGSIFFIKNKKNDGLEKPWRLILGLRYSTTAGMPIPLPFVNYFKRFDPKFSYTLGVPKTNIKYYLNKKNVFQGLVTLDGFFANIQNNRVLVQNEGSVQADSISMTIVLAGLGYEHFFTKHLLMYTYAGFTVLNDIRLRDTNRDDVLTINDTNTFYIRAGLKFKI